MKKRFELHDANIKSIVESNRKLEILVEVSVINVTDTFGFEFESIGTQIGKFSIQNPIFKSKPTVGEVFDGHLLQGEFRIDLIPLTAKYPNPCALILSQESGTHIIFSDAITFDVV